MVSGPVHNRNHTYISLLYPTPAVTGYTHSRTMLKMTLPSTRSPPINPSFQFCGNTSV